MITQLHNPMHASMSVSGVATPLLVAAATNPTTAREEPVYASVLLPPLHSEEGIDLKENDAYGILQSDAPRYETIYRPTSTAKFLILHACTIKLMFLPALAQI